MNTTFALVHATRGRPKTALKVHDDWMAKCAHPENVEYVFGIDDDDDATQRMVAYSNFRYVTAESDGCFGAYQRAFVVSTGEIIIPVEDDLWPPDQWDTELSAVVGNHAGDPAAIFVNDGQNPNISYFFTRALTAKWGYLYPPEYFGVFGDTEIRDRIQADPTILRIDASHLLFRQAHWSLGLAPKDWVYARKEAWWERDKAVYQRRKKEGGW